MGCLAFGRFSVHIHKIHLQENGGTCCSSYCVFTLPCSHGYNAHYCISHNKTGSHYLKGDNHEEKFKKSLQKDIIDDNGTHTKMIFKCHKMHPFPVSMSSLFSCNLLEQHVIKFTIEILYHVNIVSSFVLPTNLGNHKAFTNHQICKLSRTQQNFHLPWQ